jgi:predicted nucleic acid-binding protein
MIVRPRLVLDTNLLVSRLLLPDSLPAAAVRKAVREADILASDDTLLELADILSRPKFDRYVSLEDRREFLRSFGRIALKVEIVRTVHACRLPARSRGFASARPPKASGHRRAKAGDPRDNKFLELAVNGEARAIITGDRDLLDLHPFQTAQILSPAQYF